MLQINGSHCSRKSLWAVTSIIVDQPSSASLLITAVSACHPIQIICLVVCLLWPH